MDYFCCWFLLELSYNRLPRLAAKSTKFCWPSFDTNVYWLSSVHTFYVWPRGYNFPKADTKCGISTWNNRHFKAFGPLYEQTWCTHSVARNRHEVTLCNQHLISRCLRLINRTTKSHWDPCCANTERTYVSL